MRVRRGGGFGGVLLVGLFGAALLGPVPALAGDPQVTNVRAAQLTDGTKKVEVLYDLSAVPAGGGPR